MGELEAQKERLREAISLENKEIKRLWGVLTTKGEKKSRRELVSHCVSYGMLAYDGVMTLRKLKKGYGSFLNIFRR